MERRYHQEGFTLVELMVSVAILATTLTLAVPSFRTLIANSAITSEVNRLASHMHLARSEAIKRGRNMVLCATSDGLSCSRSIEWEHGYLIFMDLNRNRDLDGDEPIIAIHRPEEQLILIRSSNSDMGRKTLAYQPTGMAPGSTATIEFCHPGHYGTPKALIVANSGRPRVAKHRSDGTAITCGA